MQYTVENARFDNFRVSSDGGAIHINEAAARLRIAHSVFNNIAAMDGGQKGGSVYFIGTSHIIQSTKANRCVCQEEGQAMYIKDAENTDNYFNFTTFLYCSPPEQRGRKAGFQIGEGIQAINEFNVSYTTTSMRYGMCSIVKVDYFDVRYSNFFHVVPGTGDSLRVEYKTPLNNPTAEFRNCNFLNNTVTSGGYLLTYHYVGPRIYCCVFKDNSVPAGRGISVGAYVAPALILECWFINEPGMPTGQTQYVTLEWINYKTTLLHKYTHELYEAENVA